MRLANIITYFFILITFISGQALANQQEKIILEYADRLMAQLSYILTNQDPRKINSFLSYYINRNAKFQKQTQLYINPQNTNKEELLEKRSLDMNKREYIQHLINIASTPQTYVFKAKVAGITRMDSTRTAVVGVNIEEISLEDIKNGQDEADRVKVMGSTNCNFLITLASSSIPMIDGASCIENLVIQ